MGLKSMDCQACANLLAAWEHAVRTYTDFGLKGRRVLAHGFRLDAKEEERLRLICNEARDALLAHRQEHNILDSFGAAGPTIY